MDPQIRRFDEPAERRSSEKGRLELVTVGGMTLGRASYEPGWKWSEHVGPSVGAELVMGPGDVFAIPPGHDSWVVGDEAYVSLHLLGATDYAARHEKPNQTQTPNPMTDYQ